MLVPEWKHSVQYTDWATEFSDKLENEEKCRRAVEAATALGVPEVLSPQYLASPQCDELSLVTYLSGFHKQARIILEGSRNYYRKCIQTICLIIRQLER